MIMNFAAPMLLIDLDGRPFHLESDHEIGSGSSSVDIIFRLLLLIHHFPTLGYLATMMMLVQTINERVSLFCRLVWSACPEETCRVFADLKRNCPEPPDPLDTKERERNRTAEAKNWKAVDLPRCAFLFALSVVADHHLVFDMD